MPSDLLLFGSIEWIQTTVKLYQARQSMGMPAMRMLLILGIATTVTLVSALLLPHKRFLERYASYDGGAAQVYTLFLSAIIMGLAHLKIGIPILLLERFLPSFGWLEVFVLSRYATDETSGHGAESPLLNRASR